MKPVAKIELAVTFASIAMLLYMNPDRPWRAFVVFACVYVGWAISEAISDLRGKS